MKPRILISGSDCSRENYENAVSGAGGLPCSFYCPACDDSYDGLLLCGGDDIDPARFGQENRGSHGIDLARDRAEFALAEAYLAAGKPILGICRGLQLLNVVLGGTLLQDIGPTLHLFHTQEDGEACDKIHPVRAATGSVLYGFYGGTFAVNSSHHQALDKLGQELVAMQWSESGIVEGIEHKSRPVLGVQFHPERMSFAHRRPDAANGESIFSWFISHCKGEHHA